MLESQRATRDLGVPTPSAAAKARVMGSLPVHDPEDAAAWVPRATASLIRMAAARTAPLRSKPAPAVESPERWMGELRDRGPLRLGSTSQAGQPRELGGSGGLTWELSPQPNVLRLSCGASRRSG